MLQIQPSVFLILFNFDSSYSLFKVIEDSLWAALYKLYSKLYNFTVLFVKLATIPIYDSLSEIYSLISSKDQFQSKILTERTTFKQQVK